MINKQIHAASANEREEQRERESGRPVLIVCVYVRCTVCGVYRVYTHLFCSLLFPLFLFRFGIRAVAATHRGHILNSWFDWLAIKVFFDFH